MSISLKERVAIVTGAGNGLGRAHALALAARGAKIVVDDLGGTEQTVAEIVRQGGEAIASDANVCDFGAVQKMVDQAVARWGSVDILVNNAGILRDRTFAKMDLDDFRLVVDVHLMGSVNCIKAVWNPMRERGYGRIVNTTSSSGLFGNFGQSNYGAAKMGLVGLTQTLGLEGARDNVRVNCLAPSAATQMTQGVMTGQALHHLAPERVSSGIVFLASENAPNRAILLAGAGSFEVAYITMTRGLHVGTGADTADVIASRWAAISDPEAQFMPENGLGQSAHEIAMASAEIEV